MSSNDAHDPESKLIKAGILVEKTLSDRFKNESFQYWGLTDEFQRNFLDHVFEIIDRGIRIKRDFEFKKIKDSLNGFPDTIRNQKIIQTIENIQAEVSPYYLDSESTESMVLDYFDYGDYLKYHEGKLIVLKNNAVKEHINEEALKGVIELLKQTYSIQHNKRQTVLTSYLWQNNPEKELPELHSLMIDQYKLIASDTSYEQFKAIFTGQPIDNIVPIRWHDENASELLYFINRLEEADQVIHTSRADYKKMIACFVKPDNTPFQAAFKNLKTNIDINLSPDKQRAIEELVNNFL